MVKLIDGIIKGKRGCNVENIDGEINDVADALLRDTILEFTDEMVADNIIDFMIPGEDSVPLLITLAIKYLSDSPPARKQFTVYILYIIMNFY